MRLITNKSFILLSLLALINTTSVFANPPKVSCKTKELEKQDAAWKVNVPNTSKESQIKIKSLKGTSKLLVSFKGIDNSEESYDEKIPSWYGEYKEKIPAGVKEIVFKTKENKIKFSFCQ